MDIVLIESGARDWQIFQQRDGKADITLTGRVVRADGVGPFRVYARVVRENSFTAVTPWILAEMSGEEYTVLLKDVPAGGLYTIETTLAGELHEAEWGLKGDMVCHVGVGDLYVIAGQSNAAGYGKTPVEDAPELGVHLFRNSETWDLASHPMNNSTRTAHPINAEFGNSGHSPYLAFAKTVKKEAGYPVGLIQTSLGGSTISQWKPGVGNNLYDNMLQVIRKCGGRVRGILWYQGCSDTSAEDCVVYKDRFSELVDAMRRDLDDPALPILTVQINRHMQECLGDSFDSPWGIVREAQRRAAADIPGVYIVPTVDLTMSDAVHNNASSNMVIGERLAWCALEHLYGRPYIGTAPDIASAALTGEQTVEVRFSHVSSNLVVYTDGRWVPDFICKDDAGWNRVTACAGAADRLTLTLERPAQGKCLLSFASCQAPSPVAPFDRSSGIPILSFHDFPVEG